MPNDPYSFEPGPIPSTGGAYAPQPGSQGQAPTPQQPPATVSTLNPDGLLGYGCTIEYLTDIGLRSAPLAAPFGQALRCFWRAHTGACVKIVSVVATALGRNPILPKGTASANEVLIGWRLINFTPGEGINGVQVRGTMLVLAYALQQAPVLGTDVLDMGTSPLYQGAAATQTLNPADFIGNLTPASTVQGFSGQAITF